jgi:VWFA-related protein
LKTLKHMAEQTGGEVFEADKKDPLAEIYKEIADDMRAQYVLGYVPEKDTASGGYHRMVLTLAKSPKEMYVQARDGYYLGD